MKWWNRYRIAYFSIIFLFVYLIAASVPRRHKATVEPIAVSKSHAEKVVAKVNQHRTVTPVTKPFFLSAVIVFRFFKLDLLNFTVHDLQDWGCWLMLQGVEHIYLYDNAHTQLERIDPTMLQFKHTYVPWPQTDYMKAQQSAYTHFVATYSNLTRWFVSVDVDEYVYVGKNRTLRVWLQQYEKQNPSTSQILMQNQLYVGTPTHPLDKRRIDRYRRRFMVTEGKKGTWESRLKPIVKSNGVSHNAVTNVHAYPMRYGITNIAAASELVVWHFWCERVTVYNLSKVEIVGDVKSNPGTDAVKLRFKGGTTPPIVIVGAISTHTNQGMVFANLQQNFEGWKCLAVSWSGNVSQDINTRCEWMRAPTGAKWMWAGLIYLAAKYVSHNTPHVVLMLDDMQLNNVNISEMVYIMKENPNIGVLSPLITGASWPIMYKRFTHKVIITDAVEVFVTMFTLPAFMCFTEMINISVRWDNLSNIVGWGFDKCYHAYCASRTGRPALVTNQQATHTGTGRSSLDKADAYNQMVNLEKWMQTHYQQCGKFQQTQF